jgi:7-cyano-7-deazaguanine synthase
MIRLAVAGAWAVSQKARALATAVHAGDHFVYPDCRPPFIRTLDKALRLGNAGFSDPDLKILAPFISMGKHQICLLGSQLGVQFDKTWSCYEGEDLHCGRCGTCVERKEAFELAGVADPTIYQDVQEVK